MGHFISSLLSENFFSICGDFYKNIWRGRKAIVFLTNEYNMRLDCPFEKWICFQYSVCFSQFRTMSNSSLRAHFHLKKVGHFPHCSFISLRKVFFWQVSPQQWCLRKRVVLLITLSTNCYWRRSILHRSHSYHFLISLPFQNHIIFFAPYSPIILL